MTTTTGTRPLDDRQLGKLAVRDRVSALSHLHDLHGGVRIGLELMGISHGPVPQEQVEIADAIRHRMIGDLSDCETFLGDAEMCQLLNAAAPSYPSTRMFLTDIPAPTGLAWFADPITDPTTSPATGPGAADRRTGGDEDDYPLRAVSWSMIPLSDPADWDYEWKTPAIRAEGRFAVTLTAFTDTRNIPNPDGVPAARLPRIYPTSSVLWEVDAEDGGSFWGGSNHELAQTARAPYVKTIMAYWAIMRQRLTQQITTVVKPHPRDVANATRGRRREISGDVHVIRMRPRTRRYRYTEYQRSGNRPDWQVQWFVRPHWRSVRHAGGEIKPVLIASYLKGPEGKPLIGGERVLLPPKPSDAV
ncbi:hypothetical protein ACGFJT_37405 [Actinomadura geliboluensis]|uniref:hypothetical protein n=1 Tax=Actinomadura geliboluensis TaxID=882440 RepID=UPI0037147C12